MNTYVDHIFREQICTNKLLDRSSSKTDRGNEPFDLIGKNLTAEFDQIVGPS